MWSIDRINYTHEFKLINNKGFLEGIYATLHEARRARKIYKSRA